MTEGNLDWENHIVILGWDEFSRLVTKRLLKSNRKVAVITQDNSCVESIEEEFEKSEVHAIRRTLTNYESFTEVNINDSLKVFVNLDSDDQSLLSILEMKELYGEDQLEFVAVLKNDELKETFENAGVSYAVSRFVIASRLTTSLMYEPAVGELVEDLVAGTASDEDHDLQQYYISSESSYCGSSYGELFWDIKEKHNCVCVGLSKSSNDGRELLKDPNENRTLEEGDYVLIVVRKTDEEALEEIFGHSEGLVTDTV